MSPRVRPTPRRCVVAKLNFLSRVAEWLWGPQDVDPDLDERGAGQAARRWDGERRPMWRLTTKHGLLGDIEETSYLCDRHALGVPLRPGESLQDVTGVDHECERCTEDARGQR